MTLADVIRRIDQHHDGLSIYAAPRWRPGSRALVAREPRDGSLPKGAEGMTYLISLSRARRALAARLAWPPEHELDVEALCQAVIYYAVYDALEPRPLPADAEVELPVAI